MIRNSYLAESIAGLSITSLLFTMKAVDDIYLGSKETHGDRWRGGLGEALRDLACIHRWIDNDCSLCPDKANCFFYLFFLVDIPHPYIIEPDIELNSKINRDSQFTLYFKLLGYASNEVDRIIHVFKHLGRIGIGTKRGRFEILSVHSKKIHLSDNFSKNNDFNEMTLQLDTPLKLKDEKQGLYYNGLTFSTFFRLLIKRIINLNNIYGNGNAFDKNKIEAEKALLLKLAETIKTKDNTQWVDFIRYSSRQQKKHKIGGIIGNISFSGELKDFYPFLKIGEVIHAGLHTTSGFGRYRII